MSRGGHTGGSKGVVWKGGGWVCPGGGITRVYLRGWVCIPPVGTTLSANI